MKPILSIVIVNYNTDELLRRCVQSIKETTENLSVPECEVIVVDNASTDGSTTSITSSTGTTSTKLIKNTKNLGFARAVNQGIRESKGKYILLLNPDTEVKSGALAEMVELARKTDDAGVVGARLLNPDGSIQPSVFRFPTPWRAFQEFWLGRRVYSKYIPQGEGASEVDAIVGAAFLITPQARERVEFLDEQYFMYFEDLDYCRRVKDSGLKVYYLPEAQVVHHHGVSGRGIAPDSEQWKRLIPASKVYHGVLKHSLINFIIWSGQRWRILWQKR